MGEGPGNKDKSIEDYEGTTSPSSTLDDPIEDDDDLLSTLKMPVFRLPGQQAPASPQPEAAPEGDRAIPLSGILRGKRAFRATVRQSHIQPIRTLLPLVASMPPAGFGKAWLEGLPEGEARRLSEGGALPEPVTAEPEAAQPAAAAPAAAAPVAPAPVAPVAVAAAPVVAAPAVAPPASPITLPTTPAPTPDPLDASLKTELLPELEAEREDPLEDSLDEEPENERTSTEPAFPRVDPQTLAAEAPEPAAPEPAAAAPSSEDEEIEEIEDVAVLVDSGEFPAIAPDENPEVAEAAVNASPPSIPAQGPPPTPPQRTTAPQPQRAASTPAKGEESDDLSGLVQELLDEENKPPKASKPAGKGGAPQPTPESAWYEQIFTAEYFRTLPMGFHKQTLRETQFILDSLSVGRGGRILDLCCGFGRHTIEMAKRGYDMVGLDLSLPLLQKGLNEAQRRKLSIKFIHGDVRELNFNKVFDAVFCFHTSFGYFDDKTNYSVLQGVHSGLKTGGRFLLETVNRDFVIQQMPRRKWWEGADCLFLEEVNFNYETSVLHNKRTYIFDDARPPWEQYIYIRLYSLHEIQSLLRMAGFKVLEVSGSTAGRGAFFGPESPHLMILAEKPRG